MHIKKSVKAPAYAGLERRLRARRQRGERRKAIRWEPWKDDRRRLKGRRRGDTFYYTGANRF